MKTRKMLPHFGMRKNKNADYQACAVYKKKYTIDGLLEINENVIVTYNECTTTVNFHYNDSAVERIDLLEFKFWRKISKKQTTNRPVPWKYLLTPN